MAISCVMVFLPEKGLTLAISTIICIYQLHLCRSLGIREHITFIETEDSRHQQTVTRHKVVEATLLAILENIVFIGKHTVANHVSHRLIIPYRHIGDGGRLSEFGKIIPTADPPF